MFTTNDYVYGWLAYIVAGLVFFACWWYATRKIGIHEVRAVLRVGAVVTMFVPWYVASDSNYMAPAILMAGMEGIFDGPSAFWRAGGPLLVALGIGIVGALIFAVTRRLLSRKNTTTPAQPAS